eukprot:TRINITY_DN9630_c0_g1_i1.p1 TRINITY_DN9630_c0_g1~~TRINITY_DN9630_c0_g1_i1.p1  ORF type:complete len:455 (+),score=139.05 TRINITY_DN9630_c0_g1_i1:80-1366(+)
MAALARKYRNQLELLLEARREAGDDEEDHDEAGLTITLALNRCLHAAERRAAAARRQQAARSLAPRPPSAGGGGALAALRAKLADLEAQEAEAPRPARAPRRPMSPHAPSAGSGEASGRASRRTASRAGCSEGPRERESRERESPCEERPPCGGDALALSPQACEAHDSALQRLDEELGLGPRPPRSPPPADLQEAEELSASQPPPEETAAASQAPTAQPQPGPPSASTLPRLLATPPAPPSTARDKPPAPAPSGGELSPTATHDALHRWPSKRGGERAYTVSVSDILDDDTGDVDMAKNQASRLKLSRVPKGRWYLQVTPGLDAAGRPMPWFHPHNYAVQAAAGALVQHAFSSQQARRAARQLRSEEEWIRQTQRRTEAALVLQNLWRTVRARLQVEASRADTFQLFDQEMAELVRVADDTVGDDED